jgi:uridine kinase
LADQAASLILGPRVRGTRLVVAVDGLDGSGKSRFAVSLAAELSADGRPASLLHIDDFRRPTDFSELAPDAESAVYYERYFDFPAVGNALAAWSRGAADGAVLILEGVMLLRAALPAGTPLIVLEVSASEARRRIVARDQAKGRSPEEIAARIDRRYFPAAARYRAAWDPLGLADLVVDNEDWAHPLVVRRSDVRFAPEIAAALDRLLAAE